jgi:hypothetical protein
VVEVLDLTADRRPVAELRALARVLAAREVNSKGGLRPLTAEEFRSGWDAVRERDAAAWPGEDDAVTWHRRQLEGVLGAPMYLGLGDTEAAVWHLDRLVAAEPAEVRHRLLRGVAHAFARRWDRAAADLDAPEAGRSAFLLYFRGLAHAELREWDKAAKDFAAVASAPDTRGFGDKLAFDDALLRLARDDRAGYQEACAALRRQKDPTAKDKVLLLHVLVAGVEGLDQLEPPAQERLELGVPLLALYSVRRGGDDRVRQVAEYLDRSPNAGPAAWFVLALAREGRGDHERAREAVEQGRRRAEEDERRRQLGYENLWEFFTWDQRLVEQRLRREAETAVLGKASGTDP